GAEVRGETSGRSAVLSSTRWRLRTGDALHAGTSLGGNVHWLGGSRRWINPSGRWLQRIAGAVEGSAAHLRTGRLCESFIQRRGRTETRLAASSRPHFDESRTLDLRCQ